VAWFKKAASAVNDHYDVATELTVALAPSIRRVRKLEERGTPANGVITGIHFSLSNETTRKEFAVSVLDGNGSQRFGVRTQPTEAHRLRLGMPVVAKLDGDRGILDWDAMARAWGLEGQFLSGVDVHAASGRHRRHGARCQGATTSEEVASDAGDDRVGAALHDVGDADAELGRRAPTP
jgi:hypothetical protein